MAVCTLASKASVFNLDILAIYEESVVDKFKSNLLLVIFWLNIINYNS
jgi:hypothetical protein